jgi:hypothetical protein
MPTSSSPRATGTSPSTSQPLHDPYEIASCPAAPADRHDHRIMAGYPIQRRRPPAIVRSDGRRRSRDSGTLSGTSAEEEHMTGKIMPLRERDTSTIQAAADAFLSSPRYANPNTRRGCTGVLDRRRGGPVYRVVRPDGQPGAGRDRAGRGRAGPAQPRRDPVRGEPASGRPWPQRRTARTCRPARLPGAWPTTCPDAPVAVALATACCWKVAVHAAQECARLPGGIGFTRGASRAPGPDAGHGGLDRVRHPGRAPRRPGVPGQPPPAVIPAACVTGARLRSSGTG